MTACMKACMTAMTAYHDHGVEEGPVDQRDEHRHGARHVLQGPGDSKGFLESYKMIMTNIICYIYL